MPAQGRHDDVGWAQVYHQMTLLACPQCGAPIAFRSADLPVRVCDYCRSAILRDGEALRNVGKVAAVPEDVSPLQLGTRGRHGGRGFELVGRVRWRWDDGAWNEWLALGDDGRHFWLGEAMGRFMLLDEVMAATRKSAIVRKITDGDGPAVGDVGAIGGTDYTVTDVKQVTCVASEGALPLPTITGTRALSVDLMANNGRAASIQREGNATFAYAGRYVTLADIAATNLRVFDGWPMPRYAA